MNPDLSTAPVMLSDEDRRWMRRALRLAARGRGKTHPNPMVGAVVVRDGVLVGEGWHKGVGTPHAEAMAFAAAQEAAAGATVYVTLEPCSFYQYADGRPRVPCSERCIKARVVRVVCAMADPDSRVSGQGFAQLRAAGIDVAIGVEYDAARRLNEAYIRHRTTGLPFIVHKAAMTLDGKIAAPVETNSDIPDSKWVTGDVARAYVHRLRHQSDAIIVGIGTVLADNPSLNTRLPSGNGKDALRVVIDSRLRLPESAKVAGPGTLVLTCEGSRPDRRQLLEAQGVEVIERSADSTGRVDLEDAARYLAERGYLQVLLEAGGTLAASFWNAHLVNRALFFVAPKIIGGQNAPTPVDGVGLGFRMTDAQMLGTLKIRRFGADIALEAEVLEKERQKP